MKKLVLSLLVLSAFVAKTQTTVKLNIPNILVGLYDIQVEHAFSEKKSFQLGFGFMPKRDLLFRELLSDKDNKTFSVLEEELFTGIDFNGFRITPELKMYTGEDGAKGIYFDFWTKYSTYSLDNANYSQDYDNIGGLSRTDDFTMEGNVTSIGAGVGIGTQWFIKDLISIDILWVGLGYNYSVLTTDYTTDAIDVDWDKWKADAQADNSIYSQFGKAEFEEIDNGLKMTLTPSIPVTLRSSISLGVKF